MTDEMGHKYFLFTLFGTTFTSDLHCLTNSPQDWAIVNPCHSYSTRLCLMSHPCLAYLPSWSHFLTTLRFLLETLLLTFTLVFISESASKAYVTQFQDLQHIINRKLEGERDGCLCRQAHLQQWEGIADSHKSKGRTRSTIKSKHK